MDQKSDVKVEDGFPEMPKVYLGEHALIHGRGANMQPRN